MKRVKVGWIGLKRVEVDLNGLKWVVNKRLMSHEAILVEEDLWER